MSLKEKEAEAIDLEAEAIDFKPHTKVIRTVDVLSAVDQLKKELKKVCEDMPYLRLPNQKDCVSCMLKEKCLIVLLNKKIDEIFGTEKGKGGEKMSCEECGGNLYDDGESLECLECGNKIYYDD